MASRQKSDDLITRVTARLIRMDKAAFTGILGACAVGLGCLSPWIAVNKPFQANSLMGTDFRIGKIVLGLAVFALLAAVARRWVLLLIAAVAILGEGAYGLDSMKEIVNRPTALDIQELGFGIFLVLLGSGTMFVAASVALLVGRGRLRRDITRPSNPQSLS